MEFKDRLILAMQQKNITPAELSRITGIGEGAISQYRKGAYKATQKNLSSIAYALGVSIPWLMGIDDNEVATAYDKRIFADNLLRLMAGTGETQADIARLLSVSKSTVSAYCKATQIPRLDKIEILTAHFGVRTAELIEDSSFPTVPSPAPHDAIGHRIRVAREVLGMTQEELAKKMGYRSKSTINKIECGINDVAQSKIVKLAQALNTTPAYLMGWEVDTPAPSIPPEDMELLALFHAASPEKQAAIRALLK